MKTQVDVQLEKALIQEAYKIVMGHLISLSDRQIHELFCWSGYEMDQREEDSKGNRTGIDQSGDKKGNK